MRLPIKKILKGDLARRPKWNRFGKGMFIFNLNREGKDCIMLHRADQSVIPWNATSADLVADDWEIIDT